MDGLTVCKKDDCYLCYIEKFSDDLKHAISEELSSICCGASLAQDSKGMYTYQNTLKNFLIRYNDKTEKQKKGMIGELLSHLLVGKCIPQIITASTLFNKEDKSMKKGFDIILFNPQKKQLWYSEVKSGKNTKNDSSKSNLELLNNAQADVRNKFKTKDDTIWHNAIVDAYLTGDAGVTKNLQAILKNDAPSARETDPLKGNVVIMTVLYERLTDKIKHESLLEFRELLKKKNVFGEIIAFSIQKETYEKIEKFLQSESARLSCGS